VTTYGPGDDVFGSTFGADGSNGSFAEYATVPIGKLATMPSSLTFEEAAGIPMAGVTALQGLREGGVAAGTSLLINGASGGVGTIAVQIAADLGAVVTGVCSTRNLELVTDLGADHVIDYTETDFAIGERYDVVIDWVGNRSLPDLRRALAPDGTLVLSGGDGGRWIGPLDTLARALITNPFVGQELTWLFAETTTAELEELKAMIDDGTIEPVVDRSYPLAEAADAMAYLETGHASGKVIVSIVDER
jgi:NADPH:quinone reductase-like Zn-dependent oxidoreductase